MIGPRKANTENWDFDGKTITVRIPMTFARCGGRKVIQLDTLVYPHQQCLVVPVGERQVGRNGVVASVTGFPAIAVPGGFSNPTATAPIGVPVGIEFLGRPWRC